MVLALVIGVATMSFKLASNSEANSSSASHWYVKNQSTGIYELKPAPPVDCPEEETDEICALGFNSPQTNVTDASITTASEVRFVDEP